MRIVHVVEAWTGGIATYIQTLTQHQVALGHEVVLLCDKSKLDGWVPPVPIELIDYASSRKPWHLLSIARALRQLIRDSKADVVHCHSSFPGVYVRLCAHANVRILYTPHAWSFLKKDTRFINRLMYGAIERALANRCSRIVCMSFDEIKAARKYRIPTDKIEFVYTGIQEDIGIKKFAPRSTAPTVPGSVAQKASLPAPVAPFRIKVGYFGRLDYQKGFDILLEAVPHLSDNIEIHVFGAAVRKGVQVAALPRLYYHGWLDASLTRSAMNEMNVIVVPSRWEGLALVPIEAMRAGKVIVVSNQSSLPEQVIHGYNGIILRELTGTRLAEQLNALTVEECERMGENARHVFENVFNIDKFMASLMRTYDRV
jgi:glycosyltransferase involved in cell wall biosynthesis